jgi:hypothetical protein
MLVVLCVVPAVLACLCTHGLQTVSEMLLAGSWTMHAAVIVVALDLAIRASNWAHCALALALLCVVACPLPCALFSFNWHVPTSLIGASGVAMSAHAASTLAALVLFGTILCHEGTKGAARCFLAMAACCAVLFAVGVQRKDRLVYYAGCACEFALVAIYVAWRAHRAR